MIMKKIKYLSKYVRKSHFKRKLQGTFEFLKLFENMLLEIFSLIFHPNFFLLRGELATFKWGREKNFHLVIFSPFLLEFLNFLFKLLELKKKFFEFFPSKSIFLEKVPNFMRIRRSVWGYFVFQKNSFEKLLGFVLNFICKFIDLFDGKLKS